MAPRKRIGIPSYDAFRFTSKEHEEWYASKQEVPFIFEKHVDQGVNDEFGVSEVLHELRRENVIHLPNEYHPTLVREFYANIEDKYASYRDDVKSYPRENILH